MYATHICKFHTVAFIGLIYCLSFVLFADLA